MKIKAQEIYERETGLSSWKSDTGNWRGETDEFHDWCKRQAEILEDVRGFIKEIENASEPRWANHMVNQIVKLVGTTRR